MEQQENLKKLFIRYLHGAYTTEDLDRLLAYFDDVRSEAELRQYIERALQEDMDLSALDSKIRSVDSAAYGTLQEYTRTTQVKHWSFLRVAASIALLLTASWAIYQFAYKPTDEMTRITQGNVDENNITPGTDRAILTLADGKDYVLDGKGEEIINDGNSVRYVDGKLLASLDKPSLVALRTPMGGQYRAILPDGTKVWLNAASEIRYPSAFFSENRQVSVKGEVYFEVAKDPKRPFIVETDDQRLEVLGTHFNINAYEDDGAIWTTLSEGSVRILQLSSNKEILLKPGQQSQNLAGGGLRVQKVDIDQVISWKDGMYVLRNQEIGVFGKQLARWYNIEVDMGAYSQRKLSVIIPRSATLSTVLEAITLETGIHFKVEERRVTAIRN
ncbi:FecR family protein [Sphingobacterium yanglingense]|uniref:FecR family protein n=1 Tax=Sphingobacterium yanglingense TaxID=1437280 RepID=A0A4R6WKQ2_9SPHI|nr:FecR family protein [Sphingobacterium yanglingense]TDQ79292.1 FecR family protein [Sphingobacterium yanglingense]